MWLVTGWFDFSKLNYICTACGKDLETINLAVVVKAGYCPGSPNGVSNISHQDLFVLWNALQKEDAWNIWKCFCRSFRRCVIIERRRNPSHYGNCFICKKEDLDNHIKADYSKQKFTKQSEDNNSCGEIHWKAAGNKLKERANADETGLEIAGCRHGLAQWAVNMYQGEILRIPPSHPMQKNLT